MDTNIRRRKRATTFRRVGWLAVASMVALALAGPSVSSVAAAPPGHGNAGAIWTTSVTCTTPAAQDQNLYSVGDHVYIRGSGLAATTTYYYRIVQVNAGGGPKPVVASGSTPTDNSGYFCVDAHVIAPSEAGGEFDVQVDTDSNFHGAKHDNYKVNSTTTTTTSSSSSSESTSSSTASTSSTQSTSSSSSTASCADVVYDYSVTPGSNSYALLSVTVTAPNGVPEGCSASWSLNSYTTEGPTWATSGTQALFDHDSITLDSAHPSGTLTVFEPPCHGQTDFYSGTTLYDGTLGNGALPHYPETVTPPASELIAYSNGGNACESTTTSSTSSTTESTTPSTTTSSTSSTTTVPTTIHTTSTSSTTAVVTTAVLSSSVEATTATSSSNTGTVEAATGKPHVTPPPTATLPTSGTQGGDTWRIALLALAALLASLLILSPSGTSPERSRR